MLQSVGSQTVRHNLATELNSTEEEVTEWHSRFRPPFYFFYFLIVPVFISIHFCNRWYIF